MEQSMERMNRKWYLVILILYLLFFAFQCAYASGEKDKIRVVSSVYTGFGVPGSGYVHIRGNYAFVAPGEGDLQIIDITDKKNPKVVSFVPTADFFTELAFDKTNRYAYLPTRDVFLKYADVSDPLSPSSLKTTSWKPSRGGACRMISIYDDYAYAFVPETEYPLYVLDMKDPVNPKEISVFNTPKNKIGGRVFAFKNKAILPLHKNGIVLVNMENPTKPKIDGMYREEENPVTSKKEPSGIIAASENFLYTTKVVHDQVRRLKITQIQVIDISDSSLAYERGRYSFESDRMHLDGGWVSGDYLYVVDMVEKPGMYIMHRFSEKTKFHIFNISNPDKPILVSTYIQHEPGNFRSISVQDGYAYVNDYNFGIWIFNISNPEKITRLGGTVTAGEGHFAYVREDGKYAYLAQTFGGSIHIIDISNPENPKKRGTYWDGEWLYSHFSGRGDYLYIPVLHAVNIIDISNPDTPRKTAEFPLPDGWNFLQNPRINISMNYAFVSASIQIDRKKWDNFLLIYDIFNPGIPRLEGSLNLGSDGNYSPQIRSIWPCVYILDSLTKKFIIVDVSNVKKPVITGIIQDERINISKVFNTERAGRFWVTENKYVYIITGGWKQKIPISIVNVSDPKNPVFAGNIVLSKEVDYMDIIGSGRYLYVADYWRGLIFYDISDPLKPQEVPASESGGYIDKINWGIGALFGKYLFAPKLNQLKILNYNDKILK